MKWGILPICDKESGEIKKNKMGVYERMPTILNSIPELVNVSDVLIENQPSLKNPTMKSVQIMLFSHFVFYKQNGEKLLGTKSTIENVECMSATNKLKVYDGPEIVCKQKSKYSQRKFLAKEHTKYFLAKYGEDEYLEFFNENKKKDDLADSYLQGLFFLEREHNKKYKPKRKRKTRTTRKKKVKEIEEIKKVKEVEEVNEVENEEVEEVKEVEEVNEVENEEVEEVKEVEDEKVIKSW